MTLNQVAKEALGSVVVFLVALPLCLGIAIASGVSPAAGLLSGIVGGIVVGLLAGSPMQVSGPAAGLVVIVVDIIQNHGLGRFSVIVAVAGLLQLIAGKVQMGRWFRAVSPGVLHAMLAGIGVLIAASQLHVMIDDAPQVSGVANLLALPGAVTKALHAQGPHHVAALIGLFTLFLLVGWNLLRAHLPKSLAVLPAPLVAVGGATAVAFGLELPINYVDVPSGVGAMINPPSWADFAALREPAVIGAAIALACVASAEALLSAAAVDKLHGGARSDLNKELRAQGVGNVLLGLLGGLPVTGVIVRSSANVQSGATTRWSAVMHGVWLLVTVAFAPFVLEIIPVASLAGVLVYVGYKLVNVAAIRELWAKSRGDVAVYGVTLVSIVATSLLTGLIIGVALSVALLAWRISHVNVSVDDSVEGEVHIHLRGAATFVGLPALFQALEQVDPSAVVTLHVERLSYIDHATIEMIADWERRRETMGGTLAIQWDTLQTLSLNPRERLVV